MSPFWADIATKVAGAAALGALSALYKWIRKLYNEHDRMCKAVIALLDERRRDLQDRLEAAERAGVEPSENLLARKDRVDRIRDSEWRAAGCPREPLRRG